MTALAADPSAVAAAQPAERWLLGGVAAELAVRLNASSAFIRVLLIAASMVQPTATMSAYVAASLLLPRDGARRPGWSGVVGAGRLLLLFGLVRAVDAGGTTGWDAVFESGPEIWAPLGGAVLAGGIALMASGPWTDEVDEARSRVQVLGALPVLALVLAAIAGMQIAPDWRWERILAGAVVALGLTVALAGRRSSVVAAMLVPAALLAAVALLASSSGVRLQGGIGDVLVRPAEYHPEWTSVRRAHGDVELDLSRLLTTPGEVTVRASVGTGSLTVVVPPRAQLAADLRVGRGALWVPFSGTGLRDGLGLGLSRRLREGPTRGPRRRPLVRLRIEAQVGLGELRIERSEGGAG